MGLSPICRRSGFPVWPEGSRECSRSASTTARLVGGDARRPGRSGSSTRITRCGGFQPRRTGPDSGPDGGSAVACYTLGDRRSLALGYPVRSSRNASVAQAPQRRRSLRQRRQDGHRPIPPRHLESLPRSYLLEAHAQVLPQLAYPDPFSSALHAAHGSATMVLEPVLLLRPAAEVLGEEAFGRRVELQAVLGPREAVALVLE